MTKNTTIYDRVAYPKGKVIIREGGQQAEAYLIQSGRLGVYIERAGKKMELAVLEPGEIVGEMALISDEARSANVEALEDVTLIRISRTEFEERLEKSDRAIRAVVKMLSHRVAESNVSMAEKIAALEDLNVAAREVYEETEAEVPDINDERLLPKLKHLLKAIEEFKQQFILESIEKGYYEKE
jgi:CRP-like cAMP-binding protein